ncbi:hypothetical protein MPER_08920, partial [Moniliophthora perniciosa FA553]
MQYAVQKIDTGSGNFDREMFSQQIIQSGGGTHLPDLTVVTPVFNPEDGNEIPFYVAPRMHHVRVQLPAHLNPISRDGNVNLMNHFLTPSKGSENSSQSQTNIQGLAPLGEYNITDAQVTISAIGGATLMEFHFDEFGVETVLISRFPDGDAVFDWTGTGPQTHGNFNSHIP